MKHPSVLTLAFGLLVCAGLAYAGQEETRSLLLTQEKGSMALTADGSQPAARWNRHAQLVADGTAAVRLQLASGKIAQAAFRGETTSWAGYDALRLVVDSPAGGLISLNIMEWDGDMPENWSVQTEVAAGRQTISFALAPQPEGDLIPQLPRQDNTWNPDAELGVDLAFVAFPAEMTVLALDLVRSAGEER